MISGGKYRKIFQRAIRPGVFISLVTAIMPVTAQNMEAVPASFEDYFQEHGGYFEEQLGQAEAWREMIDELIEHPVCINSGEADLLWEFRLVSRLQLNKLKEYRLIYADLLSVHELDMIDQWDEQTIRRVLPLITLACDAEQHIRGNYNIRRIDQRIMLKTAMITQKRKGYLPSVDTEGNLKAPGYLGSPLKMSLRYDFDIRHRVQAGLRVEKDPGEPFLLNAAVPFSGLKTPDHLSGFIQLNRVKPFQQIILGDYQVRFGYGINLAGGQYGAPGQQGGVSMAHRVKPNTSMGEYGYFRGMALALKTGRIALHGFASCRLFDGSSVITDTTGTVISFGSENTAGLHRTETEIARRKRLSEKLLGATMLYSNHWLKSGILLYINEYSAPVVPTAKPYAQFEFRGKSSWVAGWSSTAWLPGMQLVMEASVSRGPGFALLAGLRSDLAPGIRLDLSGRLFGKDYHNPHGSGYVSSGRNRDERGVRMSLSTELPWKTFIRAQADLSVSRWLRYNLNFPSEKFHGMVCAEKKFTKEQSAMLSFNYDRQTEKQPMDFTYFARPVAADQYAVRLEGRFTVHPQVRMKSRIETSMAETDNGRLSTGWLMFQDVSFTSPGDRFRIWLRVCFFQAGDYVNRIYAYENDVLYDFTSFMHYGTGTRGVLMLTWGPFDWLDLWMRVSTVKYAAAKIGSGLDEINGNRLTELEFQVSARNPRQ